MTILSTLIGNSDTHSVQELLKQKVFNHPLVSTGFDGSKQTDLTGSDADEKEDMLNYINNEAQDKLVSILEAFTDISVDAIGSLYAEDIFEEGLLVRYLLKKDADSQSTTIDKNKKVLADKKPIDTTETVNALKANPDSNKVFVPFRFKQYDAYRRLFYLAAEAQIRKGILEDVVAPDEDRRQFEVTDTKLITPNMLRIFIKSDKPIQQDDPGYAYRFALAGQKDKGLNISAIPLKLWQQIEPAIKEVSFVPSLIHTAKKYTYLAGLEVLKRRPTKQPNKAQPVGLVEKRYYTLRQLKSDSDARTAEVDIYIHEGSPGSVWAMSLKAGDKIYVDNHYHETIKNMTIGQPLLICDETSMPSVAAVLERWQIQTPPMVIQISNDDAEQAYFDDMILPEGLADNLVIHHINTGNVKDVAQSVIDLIEQQEVTIDCAWGAIGSKDYRPIKKYLKEVHGLKGKLNRVRAYWVAT